MQLLSPKEQLALGFVAELYLHRMDKDGDICSSRDFAARQGVPPRYLEGSLQQLVKAGVLASVRGPRGGYKLARIGQEIKVLEVIKAVDACDADTHPALCELTRLKVTPAINSMAYLFFKQLGDCSIAAFASGMASKAAA